MIPVLSHPGTPNTQASCGPVSLAWEVTVPPLQACCVLSLVPGPGHAAMSKADTAPALSEPPRGVGETDV